MKSAVFSFHQRTAQGKRKLDKSRVERKRGGKSVKSGDAGRSVQLPSAVGWID